MDKKWISQLAADIEARHGKEARDRIFGDIKGVKDDHESISTWFDNFIKGMDELDDKVFLQKMMTDRCPCGGDEAWKKQYSETIKNNYDKSTSLEDFVASMDFGDEKELRGNVLILTKYPENQIDSGLCGMGYHCWLAHHADKYISDIYCYCCTVGHTGKPFQMAFGADTKVEFIDSLIIGGKGCIVAIHLPEKTFMHNTAVS